jgi:putative radical SAM-modified peptide
MEVEQRKLVVLDEGREDSSQVYACCAAGVSSARK